MATQLFSNPRAKPQGAFYPAPLAACLDAEGFAAAEAEIAAWPGYAPTPLVELPRLARSLGIGHLLFKDEAWRFGLDSFKALGGAYAVFRLLAARIREAGAGEATAADLAAGRHDALTRDVTVACATDGNHGRSVAWGARLFHCRCVVFIHEGVSEGRADAMARLGAEVVRVAGSYDESVRHAARVASEKGWTIVSDTAYPGYTTIPRDVMHGYGVIAGELFSQLPQGRPPSHVFLQAGVGGLAAALAARFWQRWGPLRPRVIVVEPERAACLFASAKAGGPVALSGDIETVMAGLSCGEPSLLAWPVLDAAAQDFLTIADERAIEAVRLLAGGGAGDPPLVAGETGVAGLAGLTTAAFDPALFRALGLGPESRVLVIGSEGATDPEIYERLAGRSAEAVRAAARAQAAAGSPFPARRPLGPNEPLIGRPGSRALLDTPALCLDLDALERNIAVMAALARDRGIALRPHAKTHKSLRIAEMQIAAGALGICCATIGEAEVMVAGGIKGVHVTSPQVTPSKLARVVALAAAAPRGFSVVLDDAENLAALDAAARARGIILDVLVDYSAGHHRTGAATAEDVLALAREAAAAPGLRLAGIQSYSGNLQHIADRAEREAKARARLAALAEIVERLRGEGIAVPIVTGSGTGTHDVDAAAHIFTEMQTGSYIFMDVDYHRALKDGRNRPPFETALFVQAAVVSRNGATVPGGYVTTDAGLKSFATEGAKPEILAGAPSGSSYAWFGDEHGKLLFPPGADVPALGARIELMTPHCDPTVNLYDAYHVLRGDTLVDIWPVDARGKR